MNHFHSKSSLLELVQNSAFECRSKNLKKEKGRINIKQNPSNSVEQTWWHQSFILSKDILFAHWFRIQTDRCVLLSVTGSGQYPLTPTCSYPVMILLMEAMTSDLHGWGEQGSSPSSCQHALCVFLSPTQEPESATDSRSSGTTWAKPPHQRPTWSQLWLPLTAVIFRVLVCICNSFGKTFFPVLPIKSNRLNSKQMLTGVLLPAWVWGRAYPVRGGKLPLPAPLQYSMVCPCPLAPSWLLEGISRLEHFW